MCHGPAATLPTPLEVVSDYEVAAVLAAAIRDGRDGWMMRYAEGFLASTCAEYLLERMALADFVVVRRAET